MTTRKGRLDLFSGLFLEDVREHEIDRGIEHFEDLPDKPHINGHVLSGNKTASQLGLATEQELINLSTTVAEHYNGVTADINDISETIEQNYSTTHNAIEELHELIEENVVSLQGEIDNVEDGSIVKLDYEDKGTNKELKITYGDEETEILYLNHTHTDYANVNLTNIPASYDYIFQTITYNGESGKRKWKNGRMEQWGIVTSNENGEAEFTLHEAFKDMKFIVFIEPREKGNFFHYAYPSGVQKFKARITDSAGTARPILFQWKAEGYWK